MNSNEIFISIIIPFYNRGQIVIETLKSIDMQSNSKWECLIVDDGSTKKSIDAIKLYILNNEKFILKERKNLPKGASTCRNIGIKESKGNYLVFLDSDDTISENFIENRINKISKNFDQDFIVYPSIFFNSRIGDNDKLWNILNKNTNDLERFFNEDTPWSITGPIWKKDAILSLKGFNENIQSAQDWEIHVRALFMNLKYTKVADKRKNINHFVRKGNQDRISNIEITEAVILNRFKMINQVLAKTIDYKFSNSLKNSIISYIYKNSLIAYQLNLEKESLQNMKLLLNLKLVSTLFFKLLNYKVSISQKNTIIKNKIIDFLLFRIYNISNITFPKDRTKGKISINQLGE